MDDRQYEELARLVADYPGRWIPWPVPFATRAEADRLFESLRDAVARRSRSIPPHFDGRRTSSCRSWTSMGSSGWR